MNNPQTSLVLKGRPRGVGKMGQCCSYINNNKCVCARSSSSTEGDGLVNTLVKGAVSGITEALRLVILPSPGMTEQLESKVATLTCVQDVVEVLKEDYDRAYFVTGVLSDGIYTTDCFFADPTISFRGVELWKNNLQLLVPFLIDPSIELISMESRTDMDNNGSSPRNTVVYASWVLCTDLALPWRPRIFVNGRTIYELNEEYKIYRHVEEWDINPIQALGMVLGLYSRSTDQQS